MRITLTGNANVALGLHFVSRVPNSDKPDEVFYDIEVWRDATDVKGGKLTRLPVVYLVPAEDILRLEKYLASLIIKDKLD